MTRIFLLDWHQWHRDLVAADPEGARAVERRHWFSFRLTLSDRVSCHDRMGSMDGPVGSGRHMVHLVAACVVAAACLAFSVAFDALTPALIGIVFAVIGLSSARPAFYSLTSRYLTGVAAAGGMALINATGSLGGYVGPWMVGVLKDATHSFAAGLIAMSAMLLLAAILTRVLVAVTRERRQRLHIS